MSSWYFSANASPPLISSHCFYLLSSVSASHLAPRFPAAASRAVFSSLVKDTEGRGAPLPACDLGRLSHGNEIVCGETSPLRLMARKTRSARSVISRLLSLRLHLCIYIPLHQDNRCNFGIHFFSLPRHLFLQSMNYSHLYLFFSITVYSLLSRWRY